MCLLAGNDVCNIFSEKNRSVNFFDLNVKFMEHVQTFDIFFAHERERLVAENGFAFSNALNPSPTLNSIHTLICSFEIKMTERN